MSEFLLQNDTLSAIFAFALVLIPAVIIHELGHFLAAKAVGITILEFGIGFPPRMVTLFRRGGTEYTLNWLPIGGFVRPLGEDFVKPVSAEEMEKDKQALRDRISGDDGLYSEREALRARGVEKLMSVNEARPAGRIFFMAAGALANLVTAFGIYIIIALSGLPTVVGGSEVMTRIEPDSVWEESGLQFGDVITAINGERYANGLMLAAEVSTGEPTTLTVMREDGEHEITVTPALTNGQTTPDIYVFVYSVAANSPAASVGMQPDDMIVAFNGEPFTEFEDLQNLTQSMLGQAVTLTLLRDGEPLDVTVTPRQNPPQGEGAIGIAINPAYKFDGLTYLEGAAQIEMIPQNFGGSVQYAWESASGVVTRFIQLPSDLITGRVTPQDVRPVSLIGISQIGGRFFQESIERGQPVIILEFIAVISILLGLTQLLPIPMLDGGRIVFVLLEIVRGRPIAPEREGLVHLIGMAFLLSVMVLTVLNDIINPITNQIP